MIPFQKIPEACKTTGLSQYYLRKGCKNGTVPCVMSGNTYYINVPALLRQLEALPLEALPDNGDADRDSA